MKDFLSNLNAWHVVAVGLGGAVTHIYHVVVRAGGLKKILRAFWDSPSDRLGN